MSVRARLYICALLSVVFGSQCIPGALRRKAKLAFTLLCSLTLSAGAFVVLYALGQDASSNSHTSTTCCLTQHHLQG